MWSATADEGQPAAHLGAAGGRLVAVSFVDPFTLQAWAHRDVAGLPSLAEQVRLFGDEVLPRLAGRRS
jgi:hypothetical protein